MIFFSIVSFSFSNDFVFSTRARSCFVFLSKGYFSLVSARRKRTFYTELAPLINKKFSSWLPAGESGYFLFIEAIIPSAIIKLSVITEHIADITELKRVGEIKFALSKIKEASLYLLFLKRYMASFDRIFSETVFLIIFSSENSLNRVD